MREGTALNVNNLIRLQGTLKVVRKGASDEMEGYWKTLEKTAMEWLIEAGERIKGSFSASLQIEAKSHKNDLVTNIDKEVERFLLGKIESKYPGHLILGEEGTGHDLSDFKRGIVWIVDPIDGTLNFIHQNRDFAISIGVFEDGKGKAGFIYDVMRNEMYHAIAGEGAFMNGEKLENLKSARLEESIIGLNAFWISKEGLPQNSGLLEVARRSRGTRSYGSAAIEIANVAAGRLDAYLSFNLAPWDVAGGSVIVRELGGIITDIEGNELPTFKKSTFLAAKPEIHGEIVRQLKEP